MKLPSNVTIFEFGELQKLLVDLEVKNLYELVFRKLVSLFSIKEKLMF